MTIENTPSDNFEPAQYSRAKFHAAISKRAYPRPDIYAEESKAMIALIASSHAKTTPFYEFSRR